MRSTLWQLVQPVSARFWSSVPGTLSIHSRLVSWAARLLVLPSLTSIAAGLVGRDRDRLGALQVVAGGADAQRIVAGAELARREAELALVVADHADGDDALLGADHHAFHGAFLGGGHLAGEGRRRFGSAPEPGPQSRSGRSGGDEDENRERISLSCWMESERHRGVDARLCACCAVTHRLSFRCNVGEVSFPRNGAQPTLQIRAPL